MATRDIKKIVKEHCWPSEPHRKRTLDPNDN